MGKGQGEGDATPSLTLSRQGRENVVGSIIPVTTIHYAFHLLSST
jgi:hypothetical protein